MKYKIIVKEYELVLYGYKNDGYEYRTFKVKAKVKEKP
jgi:hypothetical protein